jgi:hypothetical protein
MAAADTLSATPTLALSLPARNNDSLPRLHSEHTLCLVVEPMPRQINVVVGGDADAPPHSRDAWRRTGCAVDKSVARRRTSCQMSKAAGHRTSINPCAAGN